MKLYTEEQLRKAIDMAREYYDGFSYTEKEIIESLTPIELPSDEEIEKLELEYTINFGTNMGIGFKIGCQWIKEQILNQNK